MSEQKRYTAHEIIEAAKSLTYGDDESALEFVVAEVGDNLELKESIDETNVIASMLRQAADTEEAINAITGRYEQIKAQCLKICGKSECDNRGIKCIQCAKPVFDLVIRGEGEVAK